MDGHRLNDNVADAAYFGTESAIDLTEVDRVEIIRGAASSLYGTNAFYAVVNLITRSGRSLQGGEVRADAGTFGSYRARGMYGRRAPGGVEFLLSGGFYRSSGPNLYFPEFDSPATNNGMAVGLDGDRTADAFGKLTYQGWSFEAGVQGRKKEVPTASFETTFDDPRLTTRDGHAFAVAKSITPLPICRESTSRSPTTATGTPGPIPTTGWCSAISRAATGGHWRASTYGRSAGATSWCSAASIA